MTKTTTSTNQIISHPHFSTLTFFIGYHPINSIVFISIRNEEAGIAMRMDYPEDYDPIRITMVINNLQSQGADSVAIAFYLPDAVTDSLELIDLTQAMMEEAEITISDFFVVQKNRWKSIYCQDGECCSAQGHTLAKQSKKEFKAMVRSIEPIEYRSDDIQDLRRSGALAINDLLVDFREKGESASRHLAALVLSRLRDLTVRDYAIGVASDEIQPEMLAMWRWLIGIAPKGYLAAPSTLYAELAYEIGEVEVARQFLERALEVDPDYQLAKLLRRTYAAGWLPDHFKVMRSELHPKICESLFGASEKE